MSLRNSAAAGLVLLGIAAPAFAVDGIALISQARALAGNVTPGDAPGFPVTISQPGSYRLSDNLTVPAGIDGIQISSDDVTLDLNGFRIASAGGAATGLAHTGAGKNIAVTNGTIAPFSSGIVMLSATHVTVRDVRIGALSSVSAAVGQFALLERISAQGLLQAECPSIITENLTEGFITVVVSGGAQCVRWNNRALNFTGAVTQ